MEKTRHAVPRYLLAVASILGQVLIGHQSFAQTAAVESAGPAATPRPQKMVIVGEIKANDNAGENGAVLSPRALLNLRKDLVADFVKTRKFAVLDREFADQIAAEKHPGDLDRSEAGRTDKLGTEATADYLVSGAVKRFGDASLEQELRLSGRKVTRYKFDMSVAIQVIDVASRRVVFADSFDETAAGIVQAGTPTFDGWADDAVSRVAERACNSVLELVYPLKVVAISENGDVILNEGSGRVSEGDIFEVFALGKALTDPDTGVEIGREETLQAKINVVRVLPKTSYARIEPQSGVQVTPGSVCRRGKKQEPAATPAGDANPAPAPPEKIKVDSDL